MMGQEDICKDNVIVAGTDATPYDMNIYNSIIYLENIQLSEEVACPSSPPGTTCSTFIMITEGHTTLITGRTASLQQN